MAGLRSELAEAMRSDAMRRALLIPTGIRRESGPAESAGDAEERPDLA